MSVREWLSRRKRERQWRKAGRTVRGPLREFVYLDEVAVYSLIASQVGLVVTEVTDTQATSLQTEMSSGIGVSTPLKAEVGSKVQAGESQSSQVLRKAIIQTTFGQLRDTAERAKALKLRADPDLVPVQSLEDVKRLANDSGTSLVVPPGRLVRGDLIELDVQLEAEPIFQAGMAVSGVLDIIQDDPAAFGMPDPSQLAQLRLMSRMLDKVLAGLVPLRGCAVNFDVVEIDGAEWLVHRGLLTTLPTPPATAPAVVVGVAQQGLFWKDVRRVLFSNSEYRVLARLNRGGLQETWTPVKLVDVLAGVVPDFAEIMDTLNRGLLTTISGAVAAQQSSSFDQRVRAAVVEYAEMLGDRAGVRIPVSQLENEGLLEYAGSESMGVREWRDVLAPVTELVAREANTTIDREVAADYRVAAITGAGLLDPTETPTVQFHAELADAEERFIDCEIIAVYW